MRKLSLVLTLFVLAGAAAFAQTATVLGTVTDPTGSVVPSATITITNTSTDVKRVLKANAAGSYIAPELRIGSYSVKAEAAGFKAYERTGIKLDSNDTVRIDAVLEVGQVSESVTVAAETGTSADD